MKLPITWLLLFAVLNTALRAQIPGIPRLCGIIDVPDAKRAVFELPPGSLVGGNCAILAERQREGDVELLEIHPETASVEVKLASNPDIKTLSLTNSVADAAGGIALENAPLESVLSLFAEFSGHTLLRWQSLTNTLFTVRALRMNKATVAAVLQRALTLNHVAVIPDGDKFVMIVPTSATARAKPGAATLKSSADAPNAELLPVGTINFPNTDITQVMQIYAELVGKKLDLSARYPRGGTIHFKNQTPLTRPEVVYALDTLFAWNGVEMVPVGDSFVKPVPLINRER